MRAFAEKSIKDKLERVILVTIITTLALAGSSIIIYQWLSYRHAAVRQWWPLVEVLTDEHNGATALAFHDADAARKALAVLRGQPGIRGAWLHTADGQVLGDYIRNGDHPQPVPPDQTANATWLEGNQLLLTYRVKLRGEPVGWLTLRGDLRAEADRLRRSSLVVVICLLVAALAATAVAYRLQKTILNPVYGLARVADAVAARHDYSLRVVGEQPDELGRLTTAFNEMLEQIEQRTTQLAEIRAKLTTAEERYRQLVERVPAVTYTAEFGPAGRWRFVSPQIETLLGFNAADWMREPGLWFRQIYPEDRAHALVSEECTRTTGRYNLEYRMITRDGRMIWVRDEGVVLHEPNSTAPLLHGLLRDVTNRKTVTSALGEMRQRFEDIYQSAQDAIGYADLDGRLIDVNPAYEKLTGYTADELQMRTYQELTAPEFHALEQRIMSELLRTGQAARFEKECVCKDGSRVPVAVTAFLVRNAAGQPTGIATIAHARTAVGEINSTTV